MKKVQIYIRECGYGGIEKQAMILANALCSIYNIEIVILGTVSIEQLDLNKKINVVELGVKNTKGKFGEMKLNNVLKKFALRSDADTLISTDVVFNGVLGKCKKNRNLIYWEYKLNINEYGNLEKSLVNFNRVVLPNEFMKDCYTIKNVEVSVIPLCFEGMPDNPSDLKSDNIIALGRLNKNKCYDDLIEIMDKVHQKNGRIKLHIIGDGEEKNKLKDMVKNKKLEKNVFFEGFLSKEKINAMMENSSLFVSCARKESFGVSIIEAMSYGIPCVSYEHTSLRDFMKNEINGYLVGNRDKNKMAECILEVMMNKELRESLGNCARETSIIYDINSVKSEWLKII
ncbi:MAG: glycosyltransferase [Bacilli bacterium]|nr:glycosyltransferase [Bacilli bacterium]